MKDNLIDNLIKDDVQESLSELYDFIVMDLTLEDQLRQKDIHDGTDFIQYAKTIL